jgi:hypothetical protein
MLQRIDPRPCPYRKLKAADPIAAVAQAAPVARVKPPQAKVGYARRVDGNFRVSLQARL